ncbi:hypothetical protein K504DRAFT_497516 [Pleomassaria siparia CBS 279.74]|uniref:Uncharacterized protein n=1 Tax=Pleomassaria siparia CBS 279.74 TaxID=1314801 RepID=A0A6G1KS54_9PLEO|nr:hypothetical protein K504DRAFT_497516 [Pleomassaria siparia CBS 279.74]
MARAEEIPSARLFLGPGDELFSSDEIWIVIYQDIAYSTLLAALRPSQTELNNSDTPEPLLVTRTFVPGTMLPKQLSAWTPPAVVPQRLFDFVYRLVSDYSHSWYSSGLCSDNSRGLQQLGFGILSCFTLNFKAGANPTRPNYGLVRWRTWSSAPIIPTVVLGNTVILFSTILDNAARLAQDHYMEVAFEEPIRPDMTYVVTSMTHIQLFRKTQTTFSSTPISLFLSDAHPPSPKAFSWLLNAIHGHCYTLTTHIHRLPVELHETILDYVSNCDIDRAMYASLLDIGVPFDWTVLHDKSRTPLRLLKLRNRINYKDMHILQYVTFWDNYLGLVYQLGDKDEWCYKKEDRFVQTAIWCEVHETVEHVRVRKWGGKWGSQRDEVSKEQEDGGVDRKCHKQESGSAEN